MRNGLQASIDLIVLIFLLLIGVQSITNTNKIVADRLNDVTIEDKTAIKNYTGQVAGVHVYSTNDVRLMSVIQDENQPSIPRILITSDVSVSTDDVKIKQEVMNQIIDNTVTNTSNVYLNNEYGINTSSYRNYNKRDWWNMTAGDSKKLRTLLHSVDGTNGYFSMYPMYVNKLSDKDGGKYIWYLRPET